ncbi:MAG: DUF4440 domain-containing protein [Ignavibacteria bacterium]
MDSLFKSLMLCLFIAGIYSCSGSENKTTDADVIMQEDIKFCKYSIKEGFFNAFLKFADAGIIKFSEGQHPVVGIKDLAKAYDNRPGTKDLIWEPVMGEVAESGDLGFTWGKWHFTNKDTTLYGNYFTVWKRQSDGSWKVLLDGGNSTPAP